MHLKRNFQAKFKVLIIIDALIGKIVMFMQMHN